MNDQVSKFCGTTSLFFTCQPEHAEELQSIVGAKNLQVTT
jgi:hypothetical protein